MGGGGLQRVSPWWSLETVLLQSPSSLLSLWGTGLTGELFYHCDSFRESSEEGQWGDHRTFPTPQSGPVDLREAQRQSRPPGHPHPNGTPFPWRGHANNTRGSNPFCPADMTASPSPPTCSTAYRTSLVLAPLNLLKVLHPLIIQWQWNVFLSSQFLSTPFCRMVFKVEPLCQNCWTIASNCCHFFVII